MRIRWLLLSPVLFFACQSPTPGTTTYAKGTFGYDLAFLQAHDSVIVLGKGDARIIVSPKYQAKVFTSTASGPEGPSFGWIHYPAFEGPLNPHMNAYGGENRLWLGPEGGKYALFFSPGDSMVFNHWKTPADFDSKPWTVTGKTDTSVTLTQDMMLKNYTGSILSISVSRQISLIDDADIALLGVPAGVKTVGYETINTLRNRTDLAWNEKTGMPCLWTLDMFPTSPRTIIIIPYIPGTGSPATTDYFGEIPPDRLRYRDSVLLFKADGRSRGKLGIHPLRARPIAGSYDPVAKVLTLVEFDVHPDQPYLNQEWNTVKPPFSGDAVNAYNDGPLADGTQMGPFYELESVSPAIKNDGSQFQRVFHFTGDPKALDSLSMHLLGISTKDPIFGQ